MRTVVKAFAKLNLTLDVVAKRPDGYHDLRMIMQDVALHDRIAVAQVPGGGITVRTNLKYLPSNDKNTAVKAAQLFCGHLGRPAEGLSIEIEKRIPVGAGLGGGSSDGAAVLRALNDMLHAGLGEKELLALGLRLGSDVPYCLSGGTKLAEGRGELLSGLPALPDCRIVVCKPGFSISTRALFGELKADQIERRPDTNGAIDALGRGDLRGVARRLYNVFEDVLPPRCGEIMRIKSSLMDLGALGACMTGTGSAVFGLFDDAGRAENARRRLGGKYRDTFLTEPVRRGG